MGRRSQELRFEFLEAAARKLVSHHSLIGRVSESKTESEACPEGFAVLDLCGAWHAEQATKLE